MNAPLNLKVPAEETFIHLKQELALAADLAVPDYTTPFYLDDSETDGVTNGILFQKKDRTRKT